MTPAQFNRMLGMGWIAVGFACLSVGFVAGAVACFLFAMLFGVS